LPVFFPVQIIYRILSYSLHLLLSCTSMCYSQDGGSLRKKNKKKKRGKAQNATRTSSGDSDIALNMTNSASELVQPDLPSSRTASSTQVWF